CASPRRRAPRSARASACSEPARRTGCEAVPDVPKPTRQEAAMSRVAHPAGPRHADVLPAEHPPAPPADVNALNPNVWPRGARRADGALTLGGVDARDLAKQYGTPLFALDEDDFRGR